MNMIRIALIVGLIVGAAQAGFSAIDSFAGQVSERNAVIQQAAGE